MHRSKLHRLVHLLFAIVLVIASLTACGSDKEDPTVPDPTEVKSDQQRVTDPQVSATTFSQQMSANSAFAFDLYAQLRGEEGNLFYSPHSISSALAMLYAGAAGDTATQMAEALHFELPQSDLHATFNKLDLELSARGEGAKAADGEAFRLNVANAIWGQKDHPFEADYLDLLALNYGAGMHVMDFASDPEGSRQEINAWVEEKTEDRIKDLIPAGGIKTITKLVLTNAIYFNAAWAKAFDKANTKQQAFALLDGEEKDVAMMNATIDAKHGRVDKAQIVSIPYDGDELAMHVIVPDAGAFEEVEQGLSAGAFDALLASAMSKEVNLGLPSFETETTYELNGFLAALGMVDAFGGGAGADFSGIDGMRDLFVSKVLHKAFVKVNEEGTEAAAATAVIVDGTTSVPDYVDLTIDRPFIFVIRDNATGAILFVGRILDPEA